MTIPSEYRVKLLFAEPPLVVSPQLATAIGLNEAIILQQLHYWLVRNEHKKNKEHDGKTWMYNTPETWRDQFPFFTVDQIRYAFKHLKARGLIETGNFNKEKRDRTLWYTIDYAAFDALAQSIAEKDSDDGNDKNHMGDPPSGNIPTSTSGNIPTSIWDDSQTITRDYPETTSETNLARHSVAPTSGEKAAQGKTTPGQTPAKPKRARKPPGPDDSYPGALLDAYLAWYGTTDATAPDYPLSTFAGGAARACRMFKQLGAVGVTVETLPLALTLVEMAGKNTYKMQRRDSGLTLDMLYQAVMQGGYLLERLRTMLAPTEPEPGQGNDQCSSPWAQGYYGDEGKWFTIQRRCALLRAGTTNPAAWWKENRHDYVPGATRPKSQTTWLPAPEYTCDDDPYMSGDPVPFPTPPMTRRPRPDA